MSPTLTTFLFEMANFLILALVLGWLFFRPVRAAIEKRRASIAQEHQQAADKLAEADRLRAEIDERLAKLDGELAEKREAARQEMTEEAERIIAEAREAAERQRAALERQLTYLEDARIERLSKIVAAAAGQAVGRLLEDVAGADLDGALVHEGCRRLQTFDGNSIGPVVVESARELSAEQRTALKNSVGPAGPSMEFRRADELKVGLRISTNRGLIDLSDAGLAEYTQRILRARLHAQSQPTEGQG